MSRKGKGMDSWMPVEPGAFKGWLQELQVCRVGRDVVQVDSGMAYIKHGKHPVLFMSDFPVSKAIPNGHSRVVVRSDRREGIARIQVIKPPRWWQRLWNRLTRRYSDVSLAEVYCENGQIKKLNDMREFAL